MLHLRGCPALSDFRLQKLREQIAMHVPSLTAIQAEYLHVAELDEALDAEQQAVLKQLLSYGPAHPGDAPAGGRRNSRDRHHSTSVRAP